MRREQLEEYTRLGRWVRSSMYLRKSRAEEHMSLEETLRRHKAALMAYAERYGYQVEPEDIYEEVVSGESLFARPQMLRLMEAVSAGKYEAVLCMDMQRLGRGGMYDQGFILDTFKAAETLIVTPDRLYDLTKELDEEAAARRRRIKGSLKAEQSIKGSASQHCLQLVEEGQAFFDKRDCTSLHASVVRQRRTIRHFAP